MHKTDSVSVIIPTWNRAHVIGRAVKSVLEQTYPVHEILICDDGSTDDTAKVLAAFTDTHIRIITGPRAGRPAVPRNRGIREATGEWIAFLDSDDVWLPDKLSVQLSEARKQNCDAVCTNAWLVKPGKGRIGHYLNTSRSKFNLSDLLKINYVICSSVCARRNIIMQCGFFPEAENLKAIEDFALWLRVAIKTDFAYCAEPLIEYTDDAANSIRVDAKESVQRENVMWNFYNWCAENNISAHHREIRNALRKAMKNNGRSFFQRLKIK